MLALARASKAPSSKGKNLCSLSTFKLALLRVPVLSKAIISHFARVSSTFASLKTIDRFVAVPIATKVAIGVARLSAQGQAITNTLIAIPKAFAPLHAEIFAALQKTKLATQRAKIAQPKWLEILFASSSICALAKLALLRSFESLFKNEP